MEEFCRRMPKIELHAHLNGSCSDETIEKLKKKSNVQYTGSYYKCDTSDTISSCFQKFKQLHELCIDNEAIYTVACDVIEDFASENVRYLELRTTPRANSATQMTKSSYIESVLAAIKESKSCIEGHIIVKLIISIDRSRSLEEAWENLELAKSYKTNTSHQGSAIVGIDLSGNPETKDVAKFLPVLKAAKDFGLKLTIHLAEIPNRIDEIETLLSVQPDRIGHGTYLLPKFEACNKFIEEISAHKILIELCLTSNLLTGTVPSASEHHMDMWLNKSHPCSVCTDDKGVFSTNLSKELHLASMTFNLTEEDLWRVSYHSIDYIFSDDSTKQQLKKLWESLNPKLLFQS